MALFYTVAWLFVYEIPLVTGFGNIVAMYLAVENILVKEMAAVAWRHSKYILQLTAVNLNTLLR